MKHSNGNMLNYLKLIRYPNLIIIAFTQVIVKYFVINKLFDSLVSDIDFSFIMIIVLLIAAAGYAINDYFDIRIDRINKPEKVLINKYIPRRNAIIIHAVFNIIAILLTLYLGYKIQSLTFVALVLFMIVSLWLYSVRYKRVLFLGNMIVSLNIALAILIITFYEFYMIVNSSMQVDINFLQITFVYALYAFIINFAREIIKDIQDIKGDMKYNCQTLPIVFGIKNAKYISALFNLAIIISIVYWSITSDSVFFFSVFIYTLIVTPLLYTVFLIIRAENDNDFKFISLMLKFIMVAGIASMVILGL